MNHVATKIWSPQQEEIYYVARHENGHLVVRARAGTGKTTTIVEAVKHMPEEKILLAAFNKRIATELTRRGTRADAKTLHAVGLSFVKSQWPDVDVDFGPDRAQSLVDQVVKENCPKDIRYLIGQLHTKAREMAPHAKELGDITHIMEDFELDPEEAWWAAGYTPDFVEGAALECMEIAAREKPKLTGIDGADMIFLPLRNHWVKKRWDAVMIDEAQDMTSAQLELGMGACRGRVIIVGDDRQAIYGFRGADSGSLDRLKAELQARELGLTTTYRCGLRIVEEAQRFVPDFEAGPNNPVGAVRELPSSKLVQDAQHGDFILSRFNAPLVSTALHLLRSGKRARVAGRDIGAGLLSLIRKLRGRNIPEFLEKLRMWEIDQTERFIRAGREAQARLVRDKAEMLIELSDSVDTVSGLMGKIEMLFSDDGLGDAGIITCSSVHKAKGLEAERVFVLKNTLRDHDIEEQNIQYVAITRAKRDLVYVVGEV